MDDEARKNGQKSGRKPPPASGQFQPGNPGRPKGSRNKLGEHFVQDLYADWHKHGAEVIAKVREDDPSTYLKVTASILPKELHIKDTTLDDVSQEDLASLLADIARLETERIQAASRNGAKAPAGQNGPDSVH